MKAHEAVSEGLLILSAAVLAALLPQGTAVHPTILVGANTRAVSASIQTTFTPISATIAPVSAAKMVRKPHATPAPETHTRRVVVSLPDRRLALLEDGAVKVVYTVAVGRGSSPSPTGTFTIRERVANPTYYHDGKVIPPGPANPVGVRWIGLNKAGYGIHGTNAPRSIGHAASHGCIRMARPDLEKLFAQVREGDTVEIVGERNEETAELFDESAVPAEPAGTVLAHSAPDTGAVETNTSAVAAVPAGQ